MREKLKVLLEKTNLYQQVKEIYYIFRQQPESGLKPLY